MLTSPLDISGFKTANEPWLFPSISVKNFVSRIWFNLAICRIWSLRCLEPLFSITLCLAKMKGIMPSFYTVLRVAVWYFRELVFLGVRSQAAIDIFQSLLFIETQCCMQILNHWRHLYIPSRFIDLTEWNITSNCCIDLGLHNLCMLHRSKTWYTVERAIPRTCIVWRWAVQVLKDTCTYCCLGWAPRSTIIIAFPCSMLNVFPLCSVHLIYYI